MKYGRDMIVLGSTEQNPDVLEAVFKFHIPKYDNRPCKVSGIRRLHY